MGWEASHDENATLVGEAEKCFAQIYASTTDTSPKEKLTWTPPLEEKTGDRINLRYAGPGRENSSGKFLFPVLRSQVCDRFLARYHKFASKPFV
jgi:hypothetical protein